MSDAMALQIRQRGAVKCLSEKLLDLIRKEKKSHAEVAKSYGKNRFSYVKL